jgi:hypothetical protein
MRPLLDNSGHALVHALHIEPTLANDVDHHLIHSLVWPFFLAAFGECQLVAENLHATKLPFERHDQRRAIELRPQRILRLGKSAEVRLRRRLDTFCNPLV